MADFFQRRWRFQKKARSCRVWEMKCLGKGDQVRVSHGHLNTKTPEHPQGTDQRDAWALVKPCWELATALGPSTGRGRLCAVAFPVYSTGFQAGSAIHYLSHWHWSLIFVHARDLFIPMQNQIILSIPACTTGTNSQKKVLLRSNTCHQQFTCTDCFFKIQVFGIACHFSPTLMKVICFPTKPGPRVSSHPWNTACRCSSIFTQRERCIIALMVRLKQQTKVQRDNWTQTSLAEGWCLNY